MTPAKQARLQAAGWQVGTAEQFLDLTTEAAERVEARLQRERTLPAESLQASTSAPGCLQKLTRQDGA